MTIMPYHPGDRPDGQGGTDGDSDDGRRTVLYPTPRR
jgi:hypothetical protein